MSERYEMTYGQRERDRGAELERLTARTRDQKSETEMTRLLAKRDRVRASLAAPTSGRIDTMDHDGYCRECRTRHGPWGHNETPLPLVVLRHVIAKNVAKGRPVFVNEPCDHAVTNPRCNHYS